MSLCRPNLDLFFLFFFFVNRYYNAGFKPVEEILKPHPELVHRVDEGRFNYDLSTAMKVYYDVNYNWRRLDTTHLLINWRSTGISIINYNNIGMLLELYIFNT